MKRPKLLLLDEPMSALDKHAVDVFRLRNRAIDLFRPRPEGLTYSVRGPLG